MDLAMLRRVERTSGFVGIVLGVVILSTLGVHDAGGWTAGIAWSLFNLRAITALIRTTVSTGDTRAGRVLGILAVKFPLLYGAGAALMIWSNLPVAWLVAGFTWPFFVLFMKAAGRAWLRLDGADGARAQSGTLGKDSQTT